jgi:outer membrane protein TolC
MARAGTRVHILSLVVAVVAATASAASAQAPDPALQIFTLDQALRYAAEHYPTVRSALEQVNASAAGVDVARSAYLPRLDSLWQSSRAPLNNTSVRSCRSRSSLRCPPALPAGLGRRVWERGLARASWEPVDFGAPGRQCRPPKRR